MHVAESRLGSKVLLRSMNALLALQRIGKKKAAWLCRREDRGWIMQ
jgi:hypothetical protein